MRAFFIKGAGGNALDLPPLCYALPSLSLRSDAIKYGVMEHLLGLIRQRGRNEWCGIESMAFLASYCVSGDSPQYRQLSPVARKLRRQGSVVRAIVAMIRDGQIERISYGNDVIYIPTKAGLMRIGE